MSSGGPAPNTELAAILATLASLNKPNSQPSNQPSDWAPLPEQAQPSYPPQDQSYPQQPWVPAASVPQVEPKKIAIIDPATITEWSAGLRCVMKTVAVHDQMLKDIQKLIKTQHGHEAQWWKGREDLIKRQTARAEGQKKIDDVLKGLGGVTSGGNSNTSPEELASELKTFDMKVHRAQMQMVREMSTKLKNMGIPFFGTNSHLVIPVGKGEIVEGDGGKKLEKGMIHEAELVILQKKMLDLLEDMCSN